MWNKFGVSAEIIPCVHPVDANRRLWFGSDFPHLIEWLWHRLVTKKMLKVERIHFEMIVKLLTYISPIFNFIIN